MKRNLKEQAELRDQLAAGHPNERGLRLGISDLVAEEVLLLHEETLRRIEAEKYRQFLESKAPIAIDRGLSGKFTMKGDLRPHAKDIAAWMVRGGNRACFASFGLHKTSIQLQVCNSLLDADRKQKGLIICPLGVRREFFKEMVERGFGDRKISYVATNADVKATGGKSGNLFITNYERVRDGGIDVKQFQIVTLDEASVLRSFGSKTYQEFLPMFEGIPYKFVATATPSPNRLKELIHYAGFLGIMDTGQCLTRFFKRDPSKAGNLTIHPHKEREFWLWVSTWACFIQRPSDLGHSDEGYIRPKMEIIRHRLPVDYSTAGFDSWGQGKLIRDAAAGLSAAATEKRDSLGARIETIKEILNDLREIDVPEGILRNQQGRIAQKATGEEPQRLPEESGDVQGQVTEVERGQPREIRRTRKSPPRQKPRADNSKVQGVVCGEQSESQLMESDQEAEEIRSDSGAIHGVTPSPTGEVLDLSDRPARSIGGSLPQNRSGSGYSLHGLQHFTGPLQRRSEASAPCYSLPQFIIWCDLNDEQRAVDALLKSMGVPFTSLYGAMDIDAREVELERWVNRETLGLVTKLSMYGAGTNLQQCHIQIFAGLSYKFHDFVQGLARTDRFGQLFNVTTHLIYTESEDPIHDELMRKWGEHDFLQGTMSTLIREYGLNSALAGAQMKRAIVTESKIETGELFTGRQFRQHRAHAHHAG